MTENNKIVNSFTEYNNNYKLINLNLIFSYLAISPPLLSKISIALFITILSNKRYYKENSSDYSEAEEKRIYNSTLITPEHILIKCFPSKYNYESKDMQKDFSNLVRRLKKLDDLNIFYIWKIGFPHVYMFFIERDIGVWKFFNNKAYVTPKTILKIVKWNINIVNCMSAMLLKEKQTVSKKEIENSFGLFINRMLDKMNPLVSEKLSKWKGLGELYDYCNILQSELKDIGQFEGLEQDQNFIENLPIDIKSKIIKREGHMQGLFDIEILETGENIMKKSNAIKEARKKKLLKSKSENPTKLKYLDYNQEFNPLKNCNNLIEYYRGMVKQNIKAFKFADISLDRKSATEILDLLIMNNKNDKRFLTGWINYFINKHLSTKYFNSEDKTSLSFFKKTFEEFSSKYVEII